MPRTITSRLGHGPVICPARVWTLRGLAVCWALAVSAAPMRAADDQKATKELKERTAVTEHFATIAGQTIEYTATAGTMLLKNEEGDTTASIFYVAYTRKGVSDVVQRPITFAFNGGPGSSSAWLHLGLLGPRRVALAPKGTSPPGPPYQLEDNSDSLLDISDLVMIDPVSTGYSRAANRKEAKQFHGYEADIHSVGEFIRLYVTENGRWRSPKFMIGESYGGTRAAGLCRYLQEEHSMYFNGAVLISPALNFQTISFDKGNDLPYVMFLPAYTAAAWYHKRLDDDLQQDLKKAVDESSRFSEGEYLRALMRGDELAEDERNQMAEKVARYTGLEVDYVKRSDLRVVVWRFVKELLKDQRRTVGRFDGRITGGDINPVSDSMDYDPSLSDVSGVFTAAINDYLRRELSFDSNERYEVLTDRVQPWDFSKFENRYVDASTDLRQVMTVNPNLKLMVAGGYYDLATPLAATEYSVDHLQLAPSLQEHVTRHHYQGGHMMYLKKACLEKLRRDLARFYATAVPTEPAPVEPASTERPGAEASPSTSAPAAADAPG
jgi:carboxypeptidase C (cathepsin A)